MANKLEQNMNITSPMANVSPQLELMRRLTPENIDHYFESQNLYTQLTYKGDRDNKIMVITCVLLAIVTIFGVIILLHDLPETMENILLSIISLFIGLIGGGAGGYSLGLSKKNSEQ